MSPIATNPNALDSTMPQRTARHSTTPLAMACMLSLAFLTQPGMAVGPQYNDKGELLQPKGFRKWVFIGAPLTPHGLNNNAAGFPEFHNVYVEPTVHEVYLRTGEWPEGTMLVKELQLTQPGTFPDGSRKEVSGRGYFPSTPNGLDVSVKDSKRFGKTGNWGFFNFGHHAPPYAASAKSAPAEACSTCHAASGHKDMVFSDFYEQLKPFPVKETLQKSSATQVVR